MTASAGCAASALGARSVRLQPDAELLPQWADLSPPWCRESRSSGSPPPAHRVSEWLSLRSRAALDAVFGAGSQSTTEHAISGSVTIPSRQAGRLIPGEPASFKCDTSVNLRTVSYTHLTLPTI